MEIDYTMAVVIWCLQGQPLPLHSDMMPAKQAESVLEDFRQSEAWVHLMGRGVVVHENERFTCNDWQ